MNIVCRVPFHSVSNASYARRRLKMVVVSPTEEALPLLSPVAQAAKRERLRRCEEIAMQVRG